VRDHVLAHEEGGRDVRIEDVPPRRQVGSESGSVRGLHHTDVVVQHVDLTELVHDLAEQCVDRVLVGEIGAHRVNADVVLDAVDANHNAALPRESLGYGLADQLP
jgi:hypothetical protein